MLIYSWNDELNFNNIFIKLFYRPTMHKYTYQLSDSYRQGHNSKLKQSSYVQQSQVRGFSQSSVANPVWPNRQAVNLQSTHQHLNAISGKYRQSINPSMKVHDLGKHQVQLLPKKQYIQRRMNKLENLSQKHRVVLDNKELQNKLQMISEKYAQQYKLHRQSYNQAKQELRKYDYKINQISPQKQQKATNHKYSQRVNTENAISDTYQRYNRKPLNQNNQTSYKQVPKYQLKTNVKEYLNKQNHQKEETQQSTRKYQYLDNENKQPTEVEGSRVENQKTVAKLSLLQSRIQSSIKPYLNL